MKNMSSSIRIKTVLNYGFYEDDISDFLFSVIGEGCKRKIAVNVIDPGVNNPCGDQIYECSFYVFDSYNRLLVDPLFSNDIDYEVCHYRPEPIAVRLTNLQEFLRFILNLYQVNSLEVCIFSDEDSISLETQILSTTIDEFAQILRSYIQNGNSLNFYYKFIYNKGKSLSL